MRHPSRKHKVYTLSMTRKDEVRIRAIMAALVAQSGGVQVGPAAAMRWAMTHAERLLGLRGTGPGSASPLGGPAPEDPRVSERGTGPGTASPIGGPTAPANA